MVPPNLKEGGLHHYKSIMGIPFLPNGVDKEYLAKFSAFINSAINVMDILRYNEFENLSSETVKIFAEITDNDAIRKYSISNKLVSFGTEFRNEIDLFIKFRVINFIDHIINVILEDNIIDIERNTQIALSPLAFRLPLTLQDLRLIEYDILHKTEISDHLNPKEHGDQSLTDVVVPDLMSTINKLINHYQLIVKHITYDKSNLYRVKNNYDNDYNSLKIIILLGHLISHVARSILISKTEFDDDYDEDKNVADKTLVMTEFAKYSNIGSISLNNIILCFGYENLLPLAVYNPKGELGHTERELLLNLLVISKLTKGITK